MLSQELVTRIVDEILPDFLALIDRYITSLARLGVPMSREGAMNLIEQEFNENPQKYQGFLAKEGIPIRDGIIVRTELFRRARLRSGN